MNFKNMFINLPFLLNVKILKLTIIFLIFVEGLVKTAFFMIEIILSDFSIPFYRKREIEKE